MKREHSKTATTFDAVGVEKERTKVILYFNKRKLRLKTSGWFQVILFLACSYCQENSLVSFLVSNVFILELSLN